MSEVSQSPSEKNPPHGQALNLGALSVGDVVRVNMALHFEEARQYDLNQASDQATERENLKFIDMLRGAIQQLAAEDFDRAKEVVTALKNDRSAVNEGYGYSQMLAAELAPALVAYDYEFARDTLLDIQLGISNDDGSLYNHGNADNRAILVGIEFERLLTAEQRADFHARYEYRLANE